MKILSIETSCDETAIAILECGGGLEDPYFKEISSKVLSQIEIHKEYGGVFPALAKREHSRNLVPTLLSVLEQDLKNLKKQDTRNKQIPNLKTQKELEKILEREPELLEQFLKFIPQIEKPDIDAIAVTQGPGLEPALWVGINFAKALSLVWEKPLIPVNHMEGHIASVLPISTEAAELRRLDADIRGKNSKLKTTNYRSRRFAKAEVGTPTVTSGPQTTPDFPAIALLISGGHTELVLVKKWGEYEVVGETLDDAVGEAFDKVARMLDLPYPGGPQISLLAEKAKKSAQKNAEKTQNYAESSPRHSSLRHSALSLRESAGKFDFIKLPRPMINSADLNFSFSGLKTAVLYKLKEIPEKTDEIKQMIAKEFEDAVTDVLVYKTAKALRQYEAKSLFIGGGVSANKNIRSSFKKLEKEFPEIKVFISPKKLSTDNAQMIAMAGYLRFSKDKNILKNYNSKIEALGNMRLGE